MATTERLYQFDPKATLATDDIIYCGNTSDSSKEVQTTVAGLIGAYPGLLSIGALTTTANQIIYTTASNTYAVSGVSAFGLLALNITGAASKIMVTDGSSAPGLSSTLPAFLLGGTLSTNGQIITNSLADGDVLVNTNGTGLWLLNSTTGVSSVINDSSMATATTSNLATAASIKTYVDNVSGSGFTVILTCLLGTTANLTGTYANGAAGVGATLTNNSTQVALTIDGVLTQVADRVLVKDQTSTPDNGVYTVTTVGNGSTNWVLTRATDYDEAAEIVAGTLIPVSGGTINGGSIWIETSTVTTVGTDPIVFSIFAQPANTFVTLATNQMVTGNKEFTGTTIVPTPSTDTEAANKGYLDSTTVIAASQSQMETATSSAVFSAPAVQQFHPGHPKGWVQYNQVSNTVLASYNVTSVTDNSVGDFTVNWDVDFSSANYSVAATSSALAGGGDLISIGVFTTGGVPQIAAGTVRMVVKANTSATDYEYNSVAAFGDQA